MPPWHGKSSHDYKYAPSTLLACTSNGNPILAFLHDANLRRQQEYSKSSLASLVIVSGAGPKAFCAGGDVAALAKQNRSDGPAGREKSTAYFALEYHLDHLIATYQKPYVAYMDGITMGGGVGLSVHAPIRIATERTVFAMPETTIGFFPDVGGSFFLPRLDGFLGRYLALTSEQIRGVNAFYTGVASHYIDSSSLPNLTARLGEIEFKDYESMEDRLRTIDATIEEFHSGLPHDERPVFVGHLREAIDRCFSPDTMEGIISALETERAKPRTQSSEAVHAWTSRTLDQLASRSPTSLKATLKQLILGSQWDITSAFEREYSLAAAFMAHLDFEEGVTARLINKPATTPQWNPSALSQVNGKEVERMFLYDKTKKLNLDDRYGYRSYPYRDLLGLPSEESIESRVKPGGMTKVQLLAQVMRERQGRDGVRQKVEEVLQRKCETDKNGILRWKEV